MAISEWHGGRVVLAWLLCAATLLAGVAWGEEHMRAYESALQAELCADIRIEVPDTTGMDARARSRARSDFSFEQRLECVRRWRPAFNSRNTTRGVALSASFLSTFFVLIWLTARWMKAKPRFTGIVKWHSGQLVIAWVVAALLVGVADFWIYSESSSSDVVPGVLTTTFGVTLLMLAITWKWFGGRRK